MVRPFIFQIVGYHNSGKTTFMNQAFITFKGEGIKTATIKHHGHGGKPAIVEKKILLCILSAGAVASLLKVEVDFYYKVRNGLVT